MNGWIDNKPRHPYRTFSKGLVEPLKDFVLIPQPNIYLRDVGAENVALTRRTGQLSNQCCGFFGLSIQGINAPEIAEDMLIKIDQARGFLQAGDGILISFFLSIGEPERPVCEEMVRRDIDGFQ